MLSCSSSEDDEIIAAGITPAPHTQQIIGTTPPTGLFSPDVGLIQLQHEHQEAMRRVQQRNKSRALRESARKREEATLEGAQEREQALMKREEAVRESAREREEALLKRVRRSATP